MNFLEQLVAEWYEYSGCFILTNVKFGIRKNGGYDGEMDAVAFDTKKRKIIHIETSGDAKSWKKRERIFQKKFRNANEHYKDFNFGFDEVEKIAIAGYSNRNPQKYDFGKDIKLVLIPEFIRMIKRNMENTTMNKTIPEKYPLLRAIQFAVCRTVNKYKATKI